jgi:hypothetical protein
MARKKRKIFRCYNHLFPAVFPIVILIVVANCYFDRDRDSGVLL